MKGRGQGEERRAVCDLLCFVFRVLSRDLKPENFLLTTTHSDATLKAADFGLAAVFKPGQKFSRVCGSAMYMAPEVVRLYNGKKSKYGPPVDIWAAGVMIYIILAGSHPFSPSRDRTIHPPPCLTTQPAPNPDYCWTALGFRVRGRVYEMHPARGAIFLQSRLEECE